MIIIFNFKGIYTAGSYNIIFDVDGVVNPNGILTVNISPCENLELAYSDFDPPPINGGQFELQPIVGIVDEFFNLRFNGTLF
ncbi:hypothetical protein [Desulfitibacter alkalitolerans]|uniref:hypothetical protein n=1 Tax=Desulfitibacter alkalitolerans TaxID=264641 RepID=UPI00048357DB|nr:hypothetical protein [Desulfitibacter alkalitolerans]